MNAPLADDPVTFPKMDPVMKAAWVQALRDGSFKQGRMALRTTDDCHCCLGVLACLIDSTKWSIPEGETEWHWQPRFIDPVDEDDTGRWDDDRSTELPGKVLDAIRLNSDAMNELMVMNDGKDKVEGFAVETIREAVPAKSFAEIADWIEVNL